MKHIDNLHIVHIITKLEMGGAQKVCLTLKKGLDLNGIWTGLISGTHGELVHDAQQLPHTVLISEFTREVSIRGMFSEFICFFKLVRQLRALKKQYPDLIVHTHSTKAGLLGRWAAFFARVKKRIHTIHGYGFHNHQNCVIRFIIYSLELLTSLITTHFICVSTEDVRRGVAIFPGFEKKHTVIRAAVDWQKFQLARKQVCVPISSQVFTFGTCGCFRPGKNHIELFKAFEVVHKNYPNTRLEILGDGLLRSTYEQWIRDHNLGEHIILHGWQSQVAPIMSIWHAFVFTSLWEGMPCSIVEARILKLPVLTYETGGVRDVVVNGKNGFIYKQHDWQSLAQGMMALIQDPELYKNLCNFKDDLNDFNDAYMINHHIEFYKSL